MLDNITIKKIEDFVYAKPRNIQEISQLIKKNWRTADRYIQEIEKEYGTITTRTFREGTRGALKIVYWASIEKINNSIFQEKIAEEIEIFKKKEDLSAFDIFQHIPSKNKEVWIKQGKNEVILGRLKEFEDLLLTAKKQILFFSGNLSFINFKDKKTDIFQVLEELVKKGISMKVVCRVDIAGKENIKKLLSLNFKYGKELIQIRHNEQPLRATIIDNKIINLKEVKEPLCRDHELNKKTFIFYTIKDKEWTEWLSRIFWKLFSSSIDSNKRMQEIEKIK